MAVFGLGLAAIVLAVFPLRRDLRRQAELSLLTWLRAQADRLQPLVQQAEQRGVDASAGLPDPHEFLTPLGRAGSPAPAGAQLWLVSAVEGKPGLIVPVSATAASDTSAGAFQALQEGISAARGSSTRPLASVAGPAGPLTVAYLRLKGTGYGISASLPAQSLFGQAGVRLAGIVASAVLILTSACAGLYWLIAAPATTRNPAATPAAASPTPGSEAFALGQETGRRLESTLQQILYEVDLLQRDPAAAARRDEHLQEIRAAARQGLADLKPPRP